MRRGLSTCSTAGIVLVLTSSAYPAAPDPRMFVCPTPAAAAAFWRDLTSILDRTTVKAARLAVQHRCWVGPNEPRPVAMETGTMRIGNGGENDGYVTPDYYLYSQFLTNGLRR
jgi:hypothetical protein